MNLNSIERLRKHFDEFKKMNNGFSVRSFASLLGINAGRLSQYFNGKRFLSQEIGERIADALELSLEEKNEFLYDIEIEKTERDKAFALEKEKILKNLSADSYVQLTASDFELVSSWYYFPLLSLIGCDHFVSDSHWIADEIGITVSEAEQAITMLLKLGVVEEKNQQLRKTYNNLRTSTEIPNDFIKKYHKTSILNSLDSLELPVEERDFSSISMGIDPKKIKEAKKKIVSFRRELCAFLESGEKKEVYMMNIQLTPLKGIRK